MKWRRMDTESVSEREEMEEGRERVEKRERKKSTGKKDNSHQDSILLSSST